MRLAPTLIVIIIIFPIALSSPGEAEVNLISDPAGLQVVIEGPVSVSGPTPIPLTPLPSGQYRLSLEGPGLAQARGRLDVASGQRLSTRRWAGPEAFLSLPGLAHMRSGEKMRGMTLLSGGLFGATELLLQLSDLRDAKDAEDRASAAYLAAVSQDAISSAEANLRTATQERGNKEKLRNLWAAYLAGIWAGTAIEAWLLTPHPSISHSAEDGVYLLSAPGATRWGASVRSLLVPGSGQRFLGRNSRATLFTASFLALGAGTLIAHDSYLEAKTDQARVQNLYDRARTDEEITRHRSNLDAAAETAQDKDTVRKILGGATVGIYLWNILDAFFLAPSSSYSASPSVLSINASPGGLAATVNLEFQ